jgi:hypothetical protein
MVIVVRYADLAGINISAIREYEEFPDSNLIHTYAEEAVERAFRAGIVNGKDDGTLDPQGNATRAEFATLLQGFLELG